MQGLQFTFIETTRSIVTNIGDLNGKLIDRYFIFPTVNHN